MATSAQIPGRGDEFVLVCDDLSHPDEAELIATG